MLPTVTATLGDCRPPDRTLDMEIAGANGGEPRGRRVGPGRARDRDSDILDLRE